MLRLTEIFPSCYAPNGPFRIHRAGVLDRIYSGRDISMMNGSIAIYDVLVFLEKAVPPIAGPTEGCERATREQREYLENQLFMEAR